MFVKFFNLPCAKYYYSFPKLLSLFEGKSSFSSILFLPDFFNLFFFNQSLRNLDIFVGLSISISNNISYTKSLILNIFNFAKCLNLDISNLHFIFSKIGLLSLLEFGAVKNLSYFSTSFSNNTNIGKSIFYFCGVDLDNINLNYFLQSSFLIYQGSFYHNNLELFNLILPVSVYTEGQHSYLI